MIPQVSQSNLTQYSESASQTRQVYSSEPSGLKNRMVLAALVLMGSQNAMAADVFNPKPVNTCPNLESCAVTGWIGMGHAFVEISCGEMQEVLGFYPDENVGGNEIPNPNESNPTAARTRNTAKGSSSMKISRSAVQTSFWSFPANAAKIQAITPIATGSIIPGKSSLSVGSSALKSGASSLQLPYLNIELPAKIKEDHTALAICSLGIFPCMKVKVEVTPEIALRAYEEIESVRNAIKLYKQKKCTKNPSDHPGSYNLFNNNCVNFMHLIMDTVTGNKEWKDQILYTTPPSLSDKLTSTAWIYHNAISR